MTLVNPAAIAPAIASWNKNKNRSPLVLKTLALVALAATPTAASTPGCAPTWVSGGNYSTGSFVSATLTSTTTDTEGVETVTSVTKNFECISGVTSESTTSHCPNYDPSNAAQASVSWNDLGECSASTPFVSTVPAPSPISTWNADNGGCPDTWVEDTPYKGGDIAELDGIVYKCSPTPFINLWCGNGSYKPGDSTWWNVAWTKLGSCEGTMSPSASPVFEVLIDVGGCPLEFEQGVTYQEGDKISKDGIAFVCRPFPNSAWCSVEGYKPGSLHADQAWDLLGHCDGTISPSSSPAFTVLPDLNGCPEEYSSDTSYEANDKVTVKLNDVNSVVFQCSEDIHRSRFCNQFTPNDGYNLGWTRIGMCLTGSTIAPTTAPNFSQLTEVGDGCSNVYDTGATYEAGDEVSILSNSDERLVFVCKEWPYEAYCNAGERFSPASVNHEMGWDLKGYCQGTLSPTTSPIAYPDGTCRWYNGTTPVIIDHWSESDVSTYVAGTRVRIGDEIFKCKNYPNSLWCKFPIYKPIEFFAWDDAWTRAGTCVGAFAPTTTPTKSPSTSPTQFPVVVINVPASMLVKSHLLFSTQLEYGILKTVFEQVLSGNFKESLNDTFVLVTNTVTSIAGQTGVGAGLNGEERQHVVEYQMTIKDECNNGSCGNSGVSSAADNLFQRVKTLLSRPHILSRIGGDLLDQSNVAKSSYLVCGDLTEEDSCYPDVLGWKFESFVIPTPTVPPTNPPTTPGPTLPACKQAVVPVSDTYGILIERVAVVDVPKANSTAPWKYNLKVFDTFLGNHLYILDQYNGVIYSYEEGGTNMTKVFDISKDKIPAGLTLDFESQGIKVKSVSQGIDEYSLIVVFSSITLPDGISEAHAKLPAPGHSAFVCGANDEVADIFRIGTIPVCSATGAGTTSFTTYDSFYRYDVALDRGSLSNATAFFVSEAQVGPTHMGGGILTLPSTEILWSTGDCTMFGLDGGYVPQLDSESCGKILKIDPHQTGVYSVVAKGVGNSQQMYLAKQLYYPLRHQVVVFMDIGGVTAVEVNAFPVEALNGSEILNFGWGRNEDDGKAREGTFYVGQGKGFVQGQPACEANAPFGEDGFVQPWVQVEYATEDFFAISGFAIPYDSRRPEKGGLKLILSESNTGKLFGTTENYVKGVTPAEVFELRIFDNTSELAGLNDLVTQELGDTVYNHGDARLFRFPDGDAGLLMERTGVLYRIQEGTLF